MFEYSLENGKKQLVGGLKCLIATICIAIAFVLFMLIPNQTAQIVFVVIFSITIGILALLAIVKIIFGLVVYHAERTARGKK